MIKKEFYAIPDHNENNFYSVKNIQLFYTTIGDNIHVLQSR